MSGLGAWIWGTTQLDDAVDRATSELLPAGSEDIALNLEICDQIRSKSAPARDAMRAIKRRLNHKNPNVQLLTLSLSDICVKNGGDLFLAEVASREFMDNLVSILKIPTLNQDVKNTILRLIQNWSIAFEGKQNLSYAGTVYESLKKEGFKFPPKDLVVANSAMIDTQTAPEWIDSEVCLRCRTAFSFTNRKHHCRNCGQVFDQACSSKTMPLPHYGITQEVRVCDGCYNKLTKKSERANAAPAVKKEHRKHSQHRPPAQDLEDAELQRAIEISLRDAKGGYTPSHPAPEQWAVSEPPIIDRRTRPATTSDDVEDDPELKAAIEASLREANAPKPSAPMAEPSTRSYHQSNTAALPPPPVIPQYDLDPLETDTILTFNQTVEQVQAQGGRDLSHYPAVGEMYDKANGLRPKLAMSLDDSSKKQELLSDMHTKLSEAVKLYDSILTHQVSQPRWRSAAAPQTSAYQPVTNAYHTGYNTHWNPQQPEYAPPAHPVEQQQQYGMASPSSPPPAQWAQPQQQLSQFYDPSATAPPVQYGQQQPQQVSSPSPQLSSPSLPPVSLTQRPQFSSYMQSQQASTLPPVTFGQPAPIQSPPPPPPPQQRQQSYQENQGGLTRHNTSSYASSSALPLSPTSNLGRSNTIGSGYQPQKEQQQQQQNNQDLQRQMHIAQQQQQIQYQQQFQQQQQQRQQQQQLQQDQYRQSLIASAPLPPSLPQFPSAPTGAPQFAPGYGVEQKEERKEALLIDL